MVGGDLDIALLVGPDMENLVGLLEPVVLAVTVDDEDGEVVVQQVFEDDRGRVRFPAAALAGDEAAAREQVDDG